MGHVVGRLALDLAWFCLLQVDDRIATEGTGLALGVHDPALFFAIAAVFTGVWAVFYSGARSLGGGKGDDSGLTL